VLFSFSRCSLLCLCGLVSLSFFPVLIPFDSSSSLQPIQPAAKKKEEPKPAAEATAGAGAGASGEPSAVAAEPAAAAAPVAAAAAAPAAAAAAAPAAAAEGGAAPATAATGDAYTNTASQLMTGDALEQSITMVSRSRKKKRTVFFTTLFFFLLSCSFFFSLASLALSSPFFLSLSLSFNPPPLPLESHRSARWASSAPRSSARCEPRSTTRRGQSSTS